MSDTDIPHLNEVLEYAALLRPTWDVIDERIAASGDPTNEGDAGDGDGGGGDVGAAGAGDGTGDDAGDDPDPKAEAEKWKALARKHEKQAKANSAAARKLQEVEDAKKSETQLAAEKQTQAEQRATAAESRAMRLEVAIDKAPDGMSLAQIKKLAPRLTGSTQEELEADAVELFADFTPAGGGDPKDDKGGGRRRPTERLRPGSAPDDTSDDDGETDPSKLAAKVPRQFS